MENELGNVVFIKEEIYQIIKEKLNKNDDWVNNAELSTIIDNFKKK